jgi:hypothetical protein
MQEQNVTRAVGVLEHLTHVPSLIGGIVEFDRVELAGGWWYEADDRVWVPLLEATPGGAGREQLRARLLLAIEDHDRSRAENARALKD